MYGVFINASVLAPQQFVGLCSHRSEKLGFGKKKEKRFRDNLTRNVYLGHTFASLKKMGISKENSSETN